ncbi:putative Aromatic amino acid aminotransferase C56E4.03 [Glarea lozoyensis 74030]|uniref:Putative Aromatic amino acid aminotransferase C56E4.03 n=1 Tax=Glarea lozoyensis (strain ATCC 74030 / MF5533) TaxID=1104152 RepID=H0EJ24_GLAL7|nr:putative Aromatic amino acid aminotransferase C56E4.03 [Glarea lozoyensis 74030]
MADADFEYLPRAEATPEVESGGAKAPLDLSHHFSRVTKNRKESSIKSFYKYFQIAGIGNLAGGLPNAAFFPYDTLEAQIAQPERFKPTPNDPVDPGKFTRENLHPNVPYAGGPEIILTVGSTDGLAKTVEALSNIWSEERDWIREREGILCEEFAYMNAVQTCRPRGLNVVPVKIDFEGMLPGGKGGLEDVLANWDESKGKRPHLMYTVTKYDVIIIEDDPYWYLQFPSAVGKEAEARGLATPRAEEPHKFENSSGFPFLDSLVPSYLNVDYDGRVVRLDTFSKTVAPGCRLGWITTQPAIVERILRITESSTQQPSGFVQSMVAELLMGPQPAVSEFAKKSKADQLTFTGWKVDGWVRWLAGLRGQYERRMNRMCDILESNRYQLKQGTPTKSSESDWAVISKTEMYNFDWPRAGMFVWIQMFFDTHPLAKEVDGPTLSQSFWVFLTRKPYLILLAPGAIFSPTPEIMAEKGWQYFRACFAAVSEEEIERCSQGFADGVKGFWLIKDKKDLPSVEDDIEAAQEGLMDLGMNMAC